MNVQCCVQKNTEKASLLQRKEVNDICSFSFLKLMDEIRQKANFLYQIVLAIINIDHAERNVIKTKQSKMVAAAMAISVLMKTRNKNISTDQYVVSLLLLKVGINKMVHHSVHNKLFTLGYDWH